MKSNRDLIKDITNLEKYGIIRDPDSYSFIVVYPPSLTLRDSSDQEVHALILPTHEWALREELQLYDHNPYCTGHCKGCSFDKVSNPNDELVEKVQNAKRTEFDIYHKHARLGERTVSSIYFGGGTPTFLPAFLLGQQLNYYKKKSQLDPECEITSEASPETIIGSDGRKKLEELIAYSFNRLSIGIQELDDKVLMALNRRHNSKEALEAFENAREAGFKKINIDLMYGVMEQNIKEWLKTIKTVLELRPEYITIYNYRKEKDVKQKEFQFPSKEESFRMYLEALDMIISSGYIQIAPDQFALPKVKFRYQDKKWHHGSEFLGLGNSAYSYFNGWVYHNFRDFGSYLGFLEDGELPIWIAEQIKGEEEARILSYMTTSLYRETMDTREWLSQQADIALTYYKIEELIRRTIIFGLKTSGLNNPKSGINLALFNDRFGFDLYETPVIREELERLYNLGLLQKSPNYIKLTKTGLVIAEEVCRELYSNKVKMKLEKIRDKFGRGGL